MATEHLEIKQENLPVYRTFLIVFPLLAFFVYISSPFFLERLFWLSPIGFLPGTIAAVVGAMIITCWPKLTTRQKVRRFVFYAIYSLTAPAILIAGFFIIGMAITGDGP